MADTVLTFTTNEAKTFEVPNGANIVIEGTWDTATMTFTKTGTTLALRTPATADDSFSTQVQKGTLTCSSAGGSTSLTATIEPSRGMWG